MGRSLLPLLPPIGRGNGNEIVVRLSGDHVLVRQAGGAYSDRGRAVCRIGVLGGSEGDRMRKVPVGGVKNQRAAFLNRDVAVSARDAHRRVDGGLRHLAQRHGERPRSPLRYDHRVAARYETKIIILRSGVRRDEETKKKE